MTDILAVSLWIFMAFPDVAGKWAARAVRGYKKEMGRK